ncbi:Tat binding protein 1-interacting protein-domain-containing protein [Pisolithus croceorrhizus]|nr:Tat binding protein 1-interacting protein-domain-containing protein [Pisolithus croceorrhizus]KAI6125646.1 Tat binding protein 1-interacting protein-domain-containing protein [Pisolithus croceorrhizus]
MNRPFGAVDISANLKGAVPKTLTAKILAALAEKGEIVQKTYGKTNFYAVNQAKVETLPQEELQALELECKSVEDDNAALSAQVKQLTAEVVKLKSTPTDSEVDERLAEAEVITQRLLESLTPLRTGQPMTSAEDMARIDTDWARWRSEWVRRRKIFNTFWQIATDALSPQEAVALAEDLGIEFDRPEHVELEKGPLCAPVPPSNRTNLKRKRE